MFLSPDQIKTSLSSSEQFSSKGFDHLTLHRPPALPVRLFVSLHFRVPLVVKWSEGEDALIKASASLIICLMRIHCCLRLPSLSSLPSVSCFFALICSLTAFRINARMCDICLFGYWSEIWNSSRWSTLIIKVIFVRCLLFYFWKAKDFWRYTVIYSFHCLLPVAMTMTWFVLPCWHSTRMLPLRARFTAQHFLSLANTWGRAKYKSSGLNHL